MEWPRRLDGKSLLVNKTPDGSIYIDCVPEMDDGGGLVHRSGPHHPKHFHRFEEYNLAHGMLRCRKCGLVKETICLDT